jgi:hypothetical protein
MYSCAGEQNRAEPAEDKAITSGQIRQPRDLIVELRMFLSFETLPST